MHPKQNQSLLVPDVRNVNLLCSVILYTNKLCTNIAKSFSHTQTSWNTNNNHNLVAKLLQKIIFLGTFCYFKFAFELIFCFGRGFGYTSLKIWSKSLKPVFRYSEMYNVVVNFILLFWSSNQHFLIDFNT